MDGLNGLSNIALCITSVTDEAAGADTKAASEYSAISKSINEEGGSLPQQVFNVDEKGLYRRYMPARTFISKEEKTTLGFKASKHHLTLLLGGNTAADFKIKPLLVYHCKIPRAMKGYSKYLPVA